MTAFVLKTFAEAKALMYIDQSVIDAAAAWIESHQLSDGSFENVGDTHLLAPGVAFQYDGHVDVRPDLRREGGQAVEADDGILGRAEAAQRVPLAHPPLGRPRCAHQVLMVQ